MGHANSRQAYDHLQQKLDRMPVGAPSSQILFEILRRVYTPEQAAIASEMPLRLSSLSALARRLKRPRHKIQPILDEMADRGLLLDVRLNDEPHYVMAPTVIGFFEFTMMRVRTEVDQRELADLFHRYVLEEQVFSDQFAPETSTNLFRTLIHEPTLPKDYTEVLDWEKATYLLEEAERWAVGLCYCRHIAHHRNEECSKLQMESCLTLNTAADYVVRHQIARPIDKGEALDLLAQTREAGAAHMCDNVQRRPAFICNCCGCCCEALKLYKRVGVFKGTLSSNFEAVIDPEVCTGCKKCVKACPVDAIDVTEETRLKDGKRYKYLCHVDREACIGCGVCANRCEFASINMKPRPQRQLTPGNTASRIMNMAAEQGKVADLLLDNLGLADLSVARLLLQGFTKLVPAKKLVVKRALKSRFLDRAGRLAAKLRVPGANL